MNLKKQQKAARIALMVLKGKAVGNKSIPVDKRFYLSVIIDHGETCLERKGLFFNKDIKVCSSNFSFDSFDS